ncbi:hypothetical protein [Streptomyces sp. TLI_185]|uniref:hypothetical protein n=1 Tax=Streptomyces sp. TLI_185 TaxID=2485151 RepID=UPI001615EB53|nr:hypothetical protein [Streptomyces sp. TLI_185]
MRRGLAAAVGRTGVRPPRIRVTCCEPGGRGAQVGGRRGAAQLVGDGVAKEDAKRAAHVQTTDTFEDLKKKYADLQAHCRFLEERLQTVATAGGLLALDNAALSGQDQHDAKVRVLPRRQHLP